MRTMIIAGAALIASACGALAADVAVPGPFSPPPAFPAGPVITPGPFAPPPAFPATRVYNWTGFYVGANAGVIFGNAGWMSVPDLTSGSVSVAGGLAGGTAGYNLQTGDPLVIGAEADIDWSGYKGTAPPASCAPGCAFANPWLGTVRLRAGYALDAVMPYITGGAAIGRVNANILGAPLGIDGQNNIGWTAGAGVEVAIIGGLRAKLEYLYVDLGGFSCNVPCGGGPISFKYNTSVVRAGLNWQLWK